MNKEELKALSAQTFPSTGRGAIVATEHREFNEALIDSMVLEGQASASLDLGVNTKLFSVEGPGEIRIDYFKELLLAVDPTGTLGPIAIKNGHVLTIECYMDNPGTGPANKFIILKDGSGEFFGMPPLFSGGAGPEMRFADEGDPWSVMITITAIIPAIPQDPVNWPRIVINASQYSLVL